MQLEEKTKSSVYILQPIGRLDKAMMPEFSSRLQHNIQKGTQKILIDFSGLEFMSSSGIRELIEARKEIHNIGGEIAFCSVKDQLLELINVVHLEKTFMIFSDENEALKVLNQY